MAVPVVVAAAAKTAGKVAIKEGAKQVAKEGAKQAVKEGAKQAAKEGAKQAAADSAKQTLSDNAKAAMRNQAKDAVAKGQQSVPEPRSTSGQLRDGKLSPKRVSDSNEVDEPIDAADADTEGEGGGESAGADQKNYSQEGGTQAAQAGNAQSQNGKNAPLVDPNLGKAASSVAGKVGGPAAGLATAAAVNAANAVADAAANLANQQAAAQATQAAQVANSGGGLAMNSKNAAAKMGGGSPSAASKKTAAPAMKNPAAKVLEKTPAGKAAKLAGALTGKNKAGGGGKSPLNKGGLLKPGKGGNAKAPSPVGAIGGFLARRIARRFLLTAILMLLPLFVVGGCMAIVFGQSMGSSGSGGGSNDGVLESTRRGYVPVIQINKKVCVDEDQDSGGQENYNGLRGDSTEEQVWNFFIDHGFTPECAAGILGNAYQESGVNPKSDGGAAAGLFQCEKSTGNFQGLIDFAKSRGKDWTDLESQLLYALQDLPADFDTYTGLSPHYYDTGEWCWWPDKMSFDEYKKVNDVAKATEIFERVHERASLPNMPRRIEAAQGYYNQFKGKSSSGSSGSSGGSSSGGSSSGGSSGGSSSGGGGGPIIFIGDSRTVQMHNYLFDNLGDNITAETGSDKWRAKGSQGLAWMLSDAVPYVEQNAKSGDNVVILFGVNDVSNADKYVTEVNRLASDWKGKGINTYFVSVNPIDNSKGGTALQDSAVVEFNQKVKSGLTAATWIETYEILKADGFGGDGLHYEKADYQKIYDKIKEVVQNGPSVGGNNVTPGECPEEDEGDEEGSGYSGGRQSLASANEAQKKVVDVALHSSNVCLTANLCLAFVQDVYDEAGCGGQRYCCAHAAMDSCETHTDLDNIPVGAALFTGSSWGPVICGCGRDAGHIGIYIGDNQVCDNIGGRRTCTVDEWVSSVKANGGTVCWGWLNNQVLTK